jgi:TolA-binding protein
MVIISRGIVRMRKAQFVVDIKSYGSDTLPSSSRASAKSISSLLRPANKSVQVITNRAAVAVAFFKNSRQSITETASSLKKRFQERSKSTASVSKPDPVATPQATPPKPGQLTIPSDGWREKVASSFSSVLESTRVKTNQSLSSLKKMSQKRPAIISKASTPKSAPPVEPNQKRTIRTRLVKHKVTLSQPQHTQTQHTPPPQTSPTHAQSTPLSQAEIALSSKNYKKAEFLLLNHITKHTKDTAAYMLLGQVALAQENWSDAVEIFEQVIAWDENYFGAQAALGFAACRAGKLTRAIQALQRAHEADPENVVVLQDLLIIARRMDNPALQHSITKKLEELESPVVSSHADVSIV